MEPNSAERLPNDVPRPIEYSPVPSGEMAPDAQREQAGERPLEQAKELKNATAAATTVPVQLPQPVPVVADDQTSSDDSANPAVAADEDLIEKEWVDKAKKIISTTRDDPHAREKQVTQLQSDYLQKRYGKTLGSPE